MIDKIIQIIALGLIAWALISVSFKKHDTKLYLVDENGEQSEMYLMVKWHGIDNGRIIVELEDGIFYSFPASRLQTKLRINHE